jgi:hypothetical protein
MATTPNYGWVTPAPTDFVTDLPADFETFADAVDADLAGLLGGTIGQALVKDSNDDHDFSWQAVAAPRTLLSTTSLTGSSVSLTSIPGGYSNLLLVLKGFRRSTAGDSRLQLTINSLTSNYSGQSRYIIGGTSQVIAGQSANIRLTAASTITNTPSDNYSEITFFNYTDTSVVKSIYSLTNYFSAGSDTVIEDSIYRQNTLNAITSIEIALNADTFGGGTALLYGVS